MGVEGTMSPTRQLPLPQAEDETQTVTASPLPTRAKLGPDLVWMPYAAGLWDSKEVIVVDDGVAGFEPIPIYFELYFDYSPQNGQLAYGSEFWHPAEGESVAVSDLWVYDYSLDRESQLLEDNVGRARWSPSLPGRDQSSQLAAAVFNPQTVRFELVLVDAEGQAKLLATCASTSFSWSPDGKFIAYEGWSPQDQDTREGNCSGVYIVGVQDGSVHKVAEQPPSTGGWQGEQPIWADGRDALLLTFSSPESIFAVLPLDGSGAYTVAKSDDIAVEYLPNPMLSLWSQEHNSVIGQIEGMLDPFGVWVYEFSDDMSTIEEAYRVMIDGHALDLVLMGWWEPGRSVLLRDITNLSELNQFGRAIVWSIEDGSWQVLSDNLPEIVVPVYPPGARTDIPGINLILDTMLSGNPARRAELLRMRTLECVEEEFGIGPPHCPEGTPAGTALDVFPYQRYRRAEFASAADLEELLSFDVKGLFAVLPVSGAFDEAWWPGGEYAIVLVSGEEDHAVEILVSDSSVVRINFTELTPVELYYGYDGEYTLPPLE